MAALRAFPSSLASRCAVGSCCPVLGHPLFVSRFMTSAAMEHSTLIRSLTGVSPHFKAHPRLPIPDGFPFTLTSEVGSLNFVRHGKDENFAVDVDWKSPKTINGNPCFGMSASIERGDWLLSFDIIAGSKLMLIKQVRICQFYNRNLRCLEQLAESKGITKVIIQSLLSLARNKDGKSTLKNKENGMLHRRE